MKKSKIKTHIKGVVFFELESFDDGRGSLTELFRHDCLDSHNFPVMAYLSETKPNVSRGPHEHEDQSDLFFFAGPADFKLVLWEKSQNFVETQELYSIWREEELYREEHIVGASNPTGVIVPPGVIHGYKNISEVSGLVINAPNKLYAGPGKLYKVDEIRHEDEKNRDLVI